MTNAIEQTRRMMYLRFGIVKDLAEDAGASPCIAVREFEESLEAHIEELRKDHCAIVEERDTLRNKLQALQMASSTAAAVIRGLRSELEEARDQSFNPSDRYQENLTKAKSVNAELCKTAMHSLRIDCAKGIHLMAKNTFGDHATCMRCGARDQ